MPVKVIIGYYIWVYNSAIFYVLSIIALKKHRQNMLPKRVPSESWVLGFMVALIVWLVFTTANTIGASDGKGPLAGVLPLDENGRMQISPEDRWAIVAYVRVIQASRNSDIGDLPEDARKQLQ